MSKGRIFLVLLLYPRASATKPELKTCVSTYYTCLVNLQKLCCIWVFKWKQWKVAKRKVANWLIMFFFLFMKLLLATKSFVFLWFLNAENHSPPVEFECLSVKVAYRLISCVLPRWLTIEWKLLIIECLLLVLFSVLMKLTACRFRFYWILLVGCCFVASKPNF